MTQKEVQKNLIFVPDLLTCIENFIYEIYCCLGAWVWLVSYLFTPYVAAQSKQGNPSGSASRWYASIDKKAPAMEQLEEYRSINIENLDAALGMMRSIHQKAQKEKQANTLFEVTSEYAFLLSAKGDSKAAKDLLDQVVEQYDDDLEACSSLRLLLQRTNVAIDLNELDVAEQQLKQAVTSSCASKLFAEIDWVNAYLEASRGHYPSSVSLYERAFKANLQSGNISGMRRNLFGKGGALFRQGQFEDAEKTFLKALNYLNPPYTKINRLSIYLNLATVYAASNREADARTYYNRSLALADSLQDATSQLRILINSAILESQYQNTALALEKYGEAMALAERDKNEVGMLMVRMNKGTLLFLEGRYDEEEATLLEALNYTIQKALLNEYRYLVKLLSDLYKAKGDQSNHIIFLNQQINTLETLLGQRQKKEIDELKALYELELKNEELQNTRNRYSSIIVILLMMGGGVFTIMYLRSRNLRRLYQLNVELVHSEMPADYTKPAQSEDTHAKEEDALFMIYRKIKQVMEEEKLYRTADLTLPMLSAQIASNDKYTSSAISTYGKTNFNGFVNRYRINEAKRMLLEQGDQAIISVIAEECGFASRSTFYKAFTEQTGMTPKAFIHFSKR